MKLVQCKSVTPKPRAWWRLQKLMEEMGLSPEQQTGPKASEEARGSAERATRVWPWGVEGEELTQAGSWKTPTCPAALGDGEDQGWLRPPQFMGTLVFSEGITAFLGTKKVLLVMSIQLQVKSKYDDYILVRAESSLGPAFPVSPGSRFMAAGGMGQGWFLCHPSPLSHQCPPA